MIHERLGVTQQLLLRPKSGVEIPFRAWLEKRHSKLQDTYPVRAVYATEAAYYSEIYNVFAHQVGINILDIYSQRLVNNGSLCAADSSTPVFKYQYNHPRAFDQEGRRFHGTLASFMKNGEEITTVAINRLAESVAHGSDQEFQHLWGVLYDAYPVRHNRRIEFQQYDKLARVQFPIDLSTTPAKKDVPDILAEDWEVNMEQDMEIGIHHAVARTLKEGSVPSASSLADSLLAQEEHYERISSVNRELFAKLFFGDKKINEINRARRKGESVQLPKSTLAVLNDYIQTPNMDDALLFKDFEVEGNMLHISEGPLHISLKDGNWDNPWNCGGKQPLIPRA